MQRELKFRAYHLVDKKYVDIIGFDLEHADYVIRISGTPTIVPLKVLQVQQFTGLKDKQGNEIYEGDYMLDSHSGCWGEVKFYKGAFVVEFDNEIQDLYDWTCECVIGNIYENPELLEYR